MDLRAQLETAALALCRAGLPTSVLLPGAHALEPWCVATWERDPASEQLFWLGIELPATAEELAELLEATTLLAAVARVDFELWKRLIQEIWPREVERCSDLFATRAAPLHVGVEVRVDDEREDIVKVTDRVVTWLHGPRSDRYREARDMLVALAHASCYSTALPVVPVQISFQNYTFDHRDVREPFRNALRILQSQPQTSSYRDARVAVFRTGACYLKVTTDAVQVLHAVQALGIQVTDLPIEHLRSDELRKSDCLEFVSDLLETSTPRPTRPARRSSRRLSTRSVQERSPGVECMLLSSSLPEDLIPSVFSAIHTSKSLRSVEIDLDTARQRSNFLKWMTYALFWRDPLDAVTISTSDAQFRMADIEIMREMATAQNPLALLFPEEVASCEARFVTASEVFLSHPHYAGNPSKWTRPWSVELDVIGEGRKGYVPVLLPGWGKAWVSNESTFHRLRDTRRFHSPTQLTLQSTTQLLTQSLIAFIRLIGNDVKHVTINNYSCGQTSQDYLCRIVLAACPRLEELEVHNVALLSTQFLVDAFEENQCLALRRVKFFSVEMRSLHALDLLLQMLADPHSHATRQLQKVFYYVTPPQTVSRETLDLAVDMLRRNDRLRELALGLGRNPQLEPYVSCFAQLGGEIKGDPKPLPRRAVLAFLSIAAAARSSTSGGSPAFQQLDSVVFSHILGLAGTRRVRFVNLFLR